jgi:hypothetical protein
MMRKRDWVCKVLAAEILSRENKMEGKGETILVFQKYKGASEGGRMGLTHSGQNL